MSVLEMTKFMTFTIMNADKYYERFTYKCTDKHGHLITYIYGCTYMQTLDK